MGPVYRISHALELAIQLSSLRAAFDSSQLPSYAFNGTSS